MGACRTSSEGSRLINDCPYWDERYPCTTSYDEASPTQKAIKAHLRAPGNPVLSISSTVSMVTPDKLRSSILILRQGAEEFERAQYILIPLIEDEEAAQSITLQGLNGGPAEATTGGLGRQQ